jgi:thiamine biosynthesis protein ThiS
MKLLLNGTTRDFPALDFQATISELVAQLELAQDRVAVEHNGAIAPRETWPTTHLAENDKLEVVHFVGGGHS